MKLHTLTTVDYITYLLIHNFNYVTVELCKILDFKSNFIPTSSHFLHTLHLNVGLK
jgi:hypothetical protein